MHINYDKQKLASVLNDFYNATGVNVQFFDENTKEYAFGGTQNRYCDEIHNTAGGTLACHLSDSALFSECRKTKEPAMHICHAGLVDIAIPILYDGVMLGCLILGQMKRDNDFEKISDYLVSIGLNKDVMKDCYSSLPHYDSKKIQSISSLATMLAKYILFNRFLTPDFNGGMQRALDYIEENLHRSMSIKEIAERACTAKSTLYKNFREVFGCTVAEYVTKKRVELAQTMLLETDLSIEDISKRVGFSSGAYFTVNFKKQVGMSPSKYRKTTGKEKIL